jgi:lipopolysaccharide transport system ATP-binding protein
MSSNIAVSAAGLGKLYSVVTRPSQIGAPDGVTLPRRRLRLRRNRVRREDFWALRDVSFELPEGEVLGVIGANGAGKSTLLKILARITDPTEGQAEIRGRVGSLLEVGTGFHPDLPGRDNVFLNGAILGMRRSEIRRKFDDIVEFAGVSQFIDVPVKWYSSGMYVRLAFAVAAHLEPEILFVDEVLSVGDLAFQQKCLGRMDELAHGGRTVLFVSHNLAAVSAICTQAIYLEQGRVVSQGGVREVIDKYVDHVKAPARTSVRDRADRQGDGRIRVTDIVVGSGHSVATGEDVDIEVHYEAREPVHASVRIDVAVYGALAEAVFQCSNEVSGDRIDHLAKRGVFRLTIKRMPLAPGHYTLNVYSEVNGVVADWVQSAAFMEVLEGDYFGSGRIPSRSHGAVIVDHSWSHSESLRPVGSEQFAR